VSHLTLHSGFAAEGRWHTAAAVHRRRLPAGVRHWVLDRTSLTARLRALCSEQFAVRVLRQGWACPYPGERAVLGMRRGDVALVREVHLLCGDRVLVYARTLIPRPTLRGRCRRLARLGTRPLGEVLFADPTMRRETLELAALTRGSALYRLALRGLDVHPHAIWGRRSLFRIEGMPLLVNEIFLPGIGPLPAITPGWSERT